MMIIILDSITLITVIPAGAMVAHLTSNQGVPGSIPGSGITCTLLFLFLISTITMCLHEFIIIIHLNSLLIVGRSGVGLHLKVPQANGISTVGSGKD